MNCPSRTDELPEHDGYNQSPSALAADLTTRQDLNGMVNLRTDQDFGKEAEDARTEIRADGANEYKRLEDSSALPSPKEDCGKGSIHRRRYNHAHDSPSFGHHSRHSRSLNSYESLPLPASGSPSDNEPHLPPPGSNFVVWDRLPKPVQDFGQVFAKFLTFIGPGFLVAVAYIDPGNYSTDVSAGAATQFKLLFIVLMSNVFAIVLQSLAIRLGTVTGLNLAEHCRAHLPWWLNIPLYLLGEAAIIATDIAEVRLVACRLGKHALIRSQVIGSGIAINLLIPKIPLTWACVITVLDVLILLMFWSPNGPMRRERLFHYFIIALVLGVVICFCIELSYIHRQQHIPVGEVFRGYLPSSAVIDGKGLYLSCGILGATVMPHSLYLGSGLVQSRLRAFDVKAGNYVLDNTVQGNKQQHRPSLAAIRACLSYSIAEIVFSLCLFALLVNSAILIVAGASLSQSSTAESGDLFGIYVLLSKTLAPAAGTIFALALLLSGTSAGIVATMAGQILSEGALNWKVAPWIRRSVTRSISIIPSIIIAGAVGKDGLSAALNATQVALSVALPFVSAPLIYFTCRNKYMVVSSTQSTRREDAEQEMEMEMEQESMLVTKMRNHWIVSGFAVAIWLVIATMNMALLVFLGLGKG